MKSKKVVISLIIAIILIAGTVGGIAYYQNLQNTQEEYTQTVNKYERLKKIATKINEVVDKTIILTQDFINTNPDVR